MQTDARRVWWTCPSLANKTPAGQAEAEPAGAHAQRSQLARPATGWFEGQFQLVLAITLQQICHRIAYEPGEGNTVFLGQRRQLLVVPFIDADRDPRC
jgi:uncharacterized protein (DUF952 family)